METTHSREELQRDANNSCYFDRYKRESNEKKNFFFHFVKREQKKITETNLIYLCVFVYFSLLLARSTQKRGKSLATLRERVERQRSVTSSTNHGTESNSLEGLNLERGDSSYKTRAVEQLDNQVSSLHQDVAALSVEVRETAMCFFHHLSLHCNMHLFRCCL